MGSVFVSAALAEILRRLAICLDDGVAWVCPPCCMATKLQPPGHRGKSMQRRNYGRRYCGVGQALAEMAERHNGRA